MNVLKPFPVARLHGWHGCIGVRSFFLPRGWGGGGGGGEAVSHLPNKFLQVAQIFTKQPKGKEGHTMH